MTMESPEISQQVYDQAAAFRQTTGGVPVTVLIQKDARGFRVIVVPNDGSSPEPWVEGLVNAFGMTCQQFGMTVKI